MKSGILRSFQGTVVLLKLQKPSLQYRKEEGIPAFEHLNDKEMTQSLSSMGLI